MHPNRRRVLQGFAAMAAGLPGPARAQDTAAEIGAETWARFILKFIVSHPDVTVAIPATTRVDHVRENVAAGSGPFPDEAMRRAMAAHVREL